MTSIHIQNAALRCLSSFLRPELRISTISKSKKGHELSRAQYAELSIWTKDWFFVSSKIEARVFLFREMAITLGPPKPAAS